MRLVISRLHGTVYRANIPVNDPNALGGSSGVFLAPLSHLDALDKQPDQFRSQLIYGGEPPGRSGNSTDNGRLMVLLPPRPEVSTLEGSSKIGVRTMKQR